MAREELGSTYVPKTIAQIVTDVSMLNDFSKKVMFLEFHIQALEDEMRCSSASKHPLYYSFHFLDDAIEILKQEILRLKSREKVVQESMPVKTGCEWCSGAKESKDIDKTMPVPYDANREDSPFHQKHSSYGGYKASGSGVNFSHKAGAFIPFLDATMKNKGNDQVPSSTTESEVAPIDLNVIRKDPQVSNPHPHPQKKKQRRCWSPELNRQFVHALRQLGGVESATPKQIREVMTVEGLTNDEVKSHLQKYRNYIRKLPSPARQVSDSWPTRENQGGGSPMPLVAYPRTPQLPDLHLAGEWFRRGWSDAGSSTERVKGHGKRP